MLLLIVHSRGIFTCACVHPNSDKYSNGHAIFPACRYHSFNTQVVCDAFYRIRDVVSGVPGSVHDASIWADCSLLQSISNGQILCEEVKVIDQFELGPFVLGDAAYPLREYLQTPYKQSAATTQSRRDYNQQHSRARIKIEQTIGALKGMFPVVGWCRARLVNIPTMIYACAALYNFALLEREDVPIDEDLEPSNVE